jgi:hypothetical protein
MADPSTEATDEAKHEKEFDIVVNGEPKTVDSRTVSYEQVVAIAYPTPPSPESRFTVTYRKAEKKPHEGSLAPGQSVDVKKDGTIFNVKATGKS